MVVKVRLGPRGLCCVSYLHGLVPEGLVGRGIPEADLPVMAAGEEVMSQGVDSQSPQLICMTLEERRT